VLDAFGDKTLNLNLLVTIYWLWCAMHGLITLHAMEEGQRKSDRVSYKRSLYGRRAKWNSRISRHFCLQCFVSLIRVIVKIISQNLMISLIYHKFIYRCKANMLIVLCYFSNLFSLTFLLELCPRKINSLFFKYPKSLSHLHWSDYTQTFHKTLIDC
jgi:hypothetical protein